MDARTTEIVAQMSRELGNVGGVALEKGWKSSEAQTAVVGAAAVGLALWLGAPKDVVYASLTALMSYVIPRAGVKAVQVYGEAKLAQQKVAALTTAKAEAVNLMHRELSVQEMRAREALQREAGEFPRQPLNIGIPRPVVASDNGTPVPAKVTRTGRRAPNTPKR